MKRNLGRVRRNASEEIHVWLREEDGEQYVELRVYSHSQGENSLSLPPQEAITVPVGVLPDLWRILTRTQFHLATAELARVPPPAEEKTKRGAEGRGHRRSRRREPRVPVRLPVKCSLLGSPASSPSKPKTEQVTGQIWDVSSGGAQIWLPERFPVLSRVALVMPIGDPIFRGHAEVLGATLQPKSGKYRHNVRWLPLNAQAKAALSKLIGPPR